VGYRCGAGHESRQREGMVVHAAARRGTGAGGGGSGSGGAMPMCRAGKDQHAGGGGPVGEGNRCVGRVSWMSTGCFGSAQINSIIFHLFKNFSNGFESI
jgi:hypothetical protein